MLLHISLYISWGFVLHISASQNPSVLIDLKNCLSETELKSLFADKGSRETQSFPDKRIDTVDKIVLVLAVVAAYQSMLICSF